MANILSQFYYYFMSLIFHILNDLIFNNFDRAKLEHVVDMFTTVKLLRMQRPQMVENREQYEFCYQAAIQFVATYDEHY